MTETLDSNKPSIDQLKSALKNGQMDAAELLFSQLIEEDEFRTDVHDLYGYYAFRQGDHERACVHFSRLTELMPREARGYVNLGATYNRMKKYDEALVVLRKAIQCDAKNADAYYNIGTAEKGLHKLGLAISSFKEALRLQKDSVDTLYHLAMLHHEKGMIRQAKDYLEKVLKLQPAHAHAAEKLNELKKTEITEKQSASPFGRLVNVEELAHQVGDKQEGHRLSEEERTEDREAIDKISRSISKAAKETVQELKANYEPLLLGAIRAVIDSDAHAEDFSKACAKYQEYRPRFDEYRRHLKRAVLELRGHEEFMNAPSITGE